MPRRLRIVLVVVGLAAALEGAVSLTRAWLGTPPWWIHSRMDFEELRADCEWISGGILTVGFALLAIGVSPSSARGDLVTRPARLALVVLGLAAAVYGTASLTGGWLGKPPWWETRGRIIRRAGYEDEEWARPPAPGRKLISGGVVAVGLGLVAVGAWPRRPRPAPGP